MVILLVEIPDALKYAISQKKGSGSDMWFLYTVWQWFCYVLAAILGAALAIPLAFSILLIALGASWFMYQYIPMIYRVMRGLYYVKVKGTMPPEYVAAMKAAQETKEEEERAAALAELEAELNPDLPTEEDTKE